MFEQPLVELEGVPIRPISPLATYQIRAGVAHRNSFGPLSERHLATLAQLSERFFPDRSEEELPPSEPLPNRLPRSPGIEPGRVARQAAHSGVAYRFCRFNAPVRAP
jgi:hypothetical protein